MRRNGLVFVMMLVVCLLFCSENTNSVDPNFHISIKDKILNIQDSTIVKINMLEKDQSNFSVNWSTNNGVIKGEGDQVKYIAPNKKGKALIIAEIIDRNNKIFKDSTEILIYKQLVFLKADDVVFDSLNVISPQWRSFINFIKQKQIKASLGLIGNSLLQGSDAYYSYLKSLIASGKFEIWNHGFDHLLNGVNENREKIHEFWNTPLEQQREHLLHTQNLATEKLDLTLHTFGAPGNAIDNNTLKAVKEIDDLVVWYFGPKEFSKLSLQRFREIEYPTCHPNYQKFFENYDPQRDYYVYQLHPNAWDEHEFSEFKKAVDFLISKDVTFINPYEYYQLTR